MIVYLRTMWNMRKDCMHIAPMFSMPKLISINFMKRKLLQEGITLHELYILLRSLRYS
jgi:hypothetical protein